MLIMTTGNIVKENRVTAENFNETSSSESVPPKIRFQRDYPNYFSRLTRYVHNDDMNEAIKTANEFKNAAAEAGAPKISDLIISIKSALYEGNTKKASALLDEINIECSRHFIKTSTDEAPR